MKLFEFYRPTDVKSAVDYHQKNAGAHYIAGATNLLDLMKKNIAAPEHLIDISRLPLQSIRAAQDGLYLGALALNSAVAADKDIAKSYPLIAKALLAGASPQLRNMATIGGNILQRTRCAYFYDTTMPCNKRQPGSGCGAKEGFNRMSALFGASDQCVAVHPSDLCVALVALDAQVTVQGSKGERSIPFSELHRLPGQTPDQDTNLVSGELITSIFIPKNAFSKHNYYLKIRDRAAYAFALVSVAVALDLQGDTIQEARLALGGVAHKPWRLTETEQFLKGKKATPAVFAAAAKLAVNNAQPLQHNAFKVQLLENSIVSALQYANS